MWRATVFTLFPAMFPGPLGLSLAGEALARGRWSCETVDIRAHGLGRHHSVDDRPAGGGAGMVMRADVVAASLDARLSADDSRPRLVLSPRGQPLTQAAVRDFAAGPGLVLVCGRFEGIDERVLRTRALMEVSIGDYVLSGGEPAALVLLDACVRLLPGVMGTATSGLEESFETNLLEYPHYTRPRDFEGEPIPEVLLSGDHGRIAAWRLAEARRLTQERRPDLLDGLPARQTAVRATTSRAMSSTSDPPFSTAFACTMTSDDMIVVRHKSEGHWWRYAVAEKNGRRQLVHRAHSPGPMGNPNEAMALDAYDAATRAARQRSLVD